MPHHQPPVKEPHVWFLVPLSAVRCACVCPRVGIRRGNSTRHLQKPVHLAWSHVTVNTEAHGKALLHEAHGFVRGGEVLASECTACNAALLRLLKTGCSYGQLRSRQDHFDELSGRAHREHRVRALQCHVLSSRSGHAAGHRGGAGLCAGVRARGCCASHPGAMTEPLLLRVNPWRHGTAPWCTSTRNSCRT